MTAHSNPHILSLTPPGLLSASVRRANGAWSCTRRLYIALTLNPNPNPNLDLNLELNLNPNPDSNSYDKTPNPRSDSLASRRSPGVDTRDVQAYIAISISLAPLCPSAAVTNALLPAPSPSPTASSKLLSLCSALTHCVKLPSLLLGGPVSFTLSPSFALLSC